MDVVPDFARRRRRSVRIERRARRHTLDAFLAGLDPASVGEIRHSLEQTAAIDTIRNSLGTFAPFLLGYVPNWTWLIGIPYLVAVEAILIMGVVLFIASLDVYFRDLEHLTDVFVGLIWFYLTPVIYPLSIVPEKYHDLVLLNPMASLIEGWRGLFLHNQLPGADLWPALVFAAAIAAVGAFSFRSMEGGFADAL